MGPIARSIIQHLLDEPIIGNEHYVDPWYISTDNFHSQANQWTIQFMEFELEGYTYVRHINWWSITALINTIIWRKDSTRSGTHCSRIVSFMAVLRTFSCIMRDNWACAIGTNKLYAGVSQKGETPKTNFPGRTLLWGQMGACSRGGWSRKRLRHHSP